MSKGLGRGIEALFGDIQPIQSTDTVARLRISEIEPDPTQPRRSFDRESLEALAGSIKENGLIQPIVVRPSRDGAYRIIAGERRWRACRIAGLEEVPVIIMDVDDLQAARMTLIENLQREDLNPIEEANGYHMLMNSFDLTQEEAASAVGKSRPAVANSLRLLSLGDDIKDMVERGELSAGHARALLPLQDPELRLEAAKTAARRGMSVRELENWVKTLRKTKKEEKPEPFGVDYAAEVSRRLTQRLGRRITLKAGGKKGRVEIEYYGNEDLDTLIALLERAAKEE